MQSKMNRDEINYVIIRMKWFNELQYLLLKDNQDKDESFDEVHVQLKKRIIYLYQQLLIYLMKSVCSCYQNKILNFLRDTLKLDDWDENLESIKDAEKTVENDNFIYKIKKKTAHLETFVDIAKSSKNKDCLQHLRLTDSRHDKTCIKQTKNDLLQDSYRWILDNNDFRQWHEDKQSRLLWIKSDSDKGKTMLLCDIINELKKENIHTCLLSYFFCQAIDSRINTDTAVLRDLIYLLIDQQSSLISHVWKSYDQADKTLFENANILVALSEIFKGILQDSSLKNDYLIVDALDECIIDLSQLLDLIIWMLSSSFNVKWIVSSRNWSKIEKKLEKTGEKTRLSLELNAEFVFTAVDKYIEHQIRELALIKKYDDKTKNSVQEYLFSNANDTFLWMTLVCQNLKSTSKWKTLATLKTFSSDLKPLYRWMIQLICDSNDDDLYKQILVLLTIAYRFITLIELTFLVEMSKDVVDNSIWLKELVKQCDSFLTLHEDTVYLVHQSIKKFMLDNASNEILSSEATTIHYCIYFRSLELMSRKLHRDMYKLCVSKYLIKQMQ